MRRLGGSSCNLSHPEGQKNTTKKGTKPITIQGYEGWAIQGLDSRPRTTESGTTMGEPVHGRGPNKQLLGMP